MEKVNAKHLEMAFGNSKWLSRAVFLRQGKQESGQHLNYFLLIGLVNKEE